MASQNQDRLRSHFAAHDPSTHPDRWDALWREGTFIPWDRGYANPALIDLLAYPSNPPESRVPNPTPGAPEVKTATEGGLIALLPPALKPNGQRRKVLIPGCGKGYDVALFAAHGYDAVGLEVSEAAVHTATQYLNNPGDGPLEHEYQIEGVDKGTTQCVLGDFFDDAWFRIVATGWRDWKIEDGWDIIYDNTFLCALSPPLRPQWASRMAHLLSREGTLICLEFPTYKPAASQGPPWSLPPTVHLELLKRPGDAIQYDEDGVVVATTRSESDRALSRIAHYTPRRTHDVAVIQGVVRDCVSIWRHKL